MFSSFVNAANAAADSIDDAFAEPLPGDIQFPTSVSESSPPAICSGARIDSVKWRSDVGAAGSTELRKRKFSEE